MPSSIDACTNHNLWGDQYDRKLSEASRVAEPAGLTEQATAISEEYLTSPGAALGTAWLPPRAHQ
jgi:hypothetical protein